MNARIMAPHWVHLAWYRTKTVPHVGRVIHLIPFHALLLATTFVMSWKSYVILEQRACLPPNARSEVSVLFHDVFRCNLSCVFHRPLDRLSIIRSAQSYLVSLWCATEWSDASSVSTASDSVDVDAHNTWNPMMELLFHVQIGGIFEIFVEESDLARIALSFPFSLVLLCDRVVPFLAPLPPLLCVSDACRCQSGTLYPTTFKAGFRGNGSRWSPNRSTFCRKSEDREALENTPWVEPMPSVPSSCFNLHGA